MVQHRGGAHVAMLECGVGSRERRSCGTASSSCTSYTGRNCSSSGPGLTSAPISGTWEIASPTSMTWIIIKQKEFRKRKRKRKLRVIAWQRQLWSNVSNLDTCSINVTFWSGWRLENETLRDVRDRDSRVGSVTSR